MDDQYFNTATFDLPELGTLGDPEEIDLLCFGSTGPQTGAVNNFDSVDQLPGSYGLGVEPLGLHYTDSSTALDHKTLNHRYLSSTLGITTDFETKLDTSDTSAIRTQVMEIAMWAQTFHASTQDVLRTLDQQSCSCNNGLADCVTRIDKLTQQVAEQEKQMAEQEKRLKEQASQVSSLKSCVDLLIKYAKIAKATPSSGDRGKC